MKTLFDANMRYLPKGRQFFARVMYADEGSPFHPRSLLMCEMLDEGNEDPEIVLLETGVQIFCSECEESFVVFEGNLDLTSFISKASLAEATQMLEDFEK